MEQPEVFTKQKEVAQNLKFSELRYRRLFETAQEGIFILDADSGQVTDANPFLRKMLGYSAEEILGKELWQIGIFKDIIESKEAFLLLKKRGNLKFEDLTLHTKKGHTIDVEFISNIYTVDHHKVIQCSVRDISDRKKAEDEVRLRTKDLEQLSESQEKAKKALLNVMEDLEEAKTTIEIEKAKDDAMLASIGEGLIAVDTNRRIITINKSAEKMLGWRIKEVVGKEITGIALEDEQGQLIPKDSRPTHITLTTGKTTSGIYSFVKKDGSRLPIFITATPIKLGGKIIGALDTFRDITREKEIDKAKSEFVSLASHQLRTPLGIIKWYLEALKNEEYLKKSPKIIRKYFDEVYKSNERVLSLVRDLLSVSRIEQGKVKNTPKPVNIVLIIQEVVELMQVVANKKKIDLQLSIADQNIPSISIDALRFHEVIENLIVNAIEYTKPPGSVKVHVNRIEKDTLLITVKDTGIGISEADQKKLFTKFFRAAKAVGHNPEGSGLGLYVVKSYVEGWGGKISAKSAEGKGSIFTISLPIKKRRMKKRKERL